MKRKSTGDYPSNWEEIATQIKRDAGWKCVRCGRLHEVETGYCLTVHHLTGEKNNCAWWNCPALCQRCHLSIQGKVTMSQPWMFEHSEWFKPYVAGYYAHVQGLCEDRPYVMAHLVELLEYGRPK